MLEKKCYYKSREFGISSPLFAKQSAGAIEDTGWLDPIDRGFAEFGQPSAALVRSTGSMLSSIIFTIANIS